MAFTFTCQQCGKEFQFHSKAQPRKFCSQACVGLSQRAKREQAICKGCGELFDVTPKRKDFCSVDCFYANAPRRTLEERFWEKVCIPNDPDVCWEWTHGLTSYGYGQLNVEGKPKGAHIVSYELHYGPVPDGLILDHLCRNRKCVNPKHLEAVTYHINSERGECPAWVAHRTDTCKRGHPFTPDNTIYRLSPKGTKWRQCRACTNASHLRKYHERKKAA